MSKSKIPTTARAAVKRRSLGRCERCFARGTDVHHRKRGNPRHHNLANLTFLCRACHDKATRSPQKLARTGWVLTGTFAAENASTSPVALLGKVWAELTEAGAYRVGTVIFTDLGQIAQAAQIGPLARTSNHRLSQAMQAAISPGDELDTGQGQPESVSSLLRPPGNMRIPGSFRVQGVESVDDFRARIAQELKPVHGVGEKIGPLDQVS